MLRNQPIYLATFISLSHGAFLWLWTWAFHDTTSKYHGFFLVKRWDTTVFGAYLCCSFKGGCKENKQHTLHRAINQHLVSDILGDLKTEQEYWSGEETKVGRQSHLLYNWVKYGHIYGFSSSPEHLVYYLSLMGLR